MLAFLTWLQNSAAGHVMRESGVWIYGVVNLFHILGVASLFGAVLILDLRLLGVWRKIPLAAITQPTLSLAIAGFGLAAVSGVFLIATKATEYAGNPFIYIKFPAIGLAILNVLILNSTQAWKQHKTRPLSPAEQRTLGVMAGISLVCWLTAITAGRMIGYW